MTIRSELIRSARVNAGLKGREVAAMVETDTARIYAMESGAKPVSELTLRRYMEAGLITREQAADALLGDAA